MFGAQKADLESALLGAFLDKKMDLTVAAQVVPEIVDWQWESKQGKWLAEQVALAWKNRELPTAALIFSAVPKKGEDLDPTYLDFILQAKKNGGAAKTTWERLSAMRRLDAVRRKCSEALDAIDEGKKEDEVIALAQQASVVGTATTTKIQDWFATAEKRLETYSKNRPKERVPRFSTGLPFIDAGLGGYGVPLHGRLVFFLASTNVGKSTISTSVMRSALKTKDVHVLDLRTEEIEEDVFARWDSMLLGVSRLAISNQGLDDDQIEEARNRLKTLNEYRGRIGIGSVPMRSPISVARGHVERFRAEIGPSAKLVILFDSPDHTVSGIRHHTPRESIEHVWMEMKGWTTDHYLGRPTTVVTTHSTRDSAGEAPTAETASNSYDKSRIADLGIGIYEDGEKGAREHTIGDRKYKLLNMGIINKNRISGVKGEFQQVRAFLDECYFEQVQKGEERRRRILRGED